MPQIAVPLADPSFSAAPRIPSQASSFEMLRFGSPMSPPAFSPPLPSHRHPPNSSISSSLDEDIEQMPCLCHLLLNLLQLIAVEGKFDAPSFLVKLLIPNQFFPFLVQLSEFVFDASNLVHHT